MTGYRVRYTLAPKLDDLPRLGQTADSVEDLGPELSLRVEEPRTLGSPGRGGAW